MVSTGLSFAHRTVPQVPTAAPTDDLNLTNSNFDPSFVSRDQVTK